MTAALEDGVALEGALSVTPEQVGPASPYPRMAEVRELRPETASAATEEIPAVTDDEPATGEVEHQEPASAVAPAAEPSGNQPDFTRPVAVTVAAAPAPRPLPTEIRIKQVKPATTEAEEMLAVDDAEPDPGTASPSSAPKSTSVPDFEHVPSPRRDSAIMARPAVTPKLIKVKPLPSMPKPMPSPEPASAVSVDAEQFETAREIIGGFFYRVIKKTFGAKERAAEEATRHTSWFVVVTTSVFAVIATAAAFTISFTTLLLTMEAMGLGDVAHFGPISIDISALAAAVFLITPGRDNKRLGWMFLTFSTGASIYGNLVGHAIQEERGAAPFQLPGGFFWEQAGLFFSVFFPLAMAILVHAAIKQINGNLEHRKRRKEEQAARDKQAAEERARADQEERERQKREAAAQAVREEALANLPKPARKNQTVDRDTAIQYGIAYETYTPARLGQLLTEARWAPRGETAMKDYCKAIKKELGIV